MILPALGASLFLLGLLHRLQPVQALDRSVFRWLHARIWRGYPLFRLLWPLGTTPATLFLLFALLLFRFDLGVGAGALYLFAALLERGIKQAVRRQRPFRSLSGVHMTQIKTPHDPSFPSGDALRLWFWFAVFATGGLLPPAATALIGLLAALVSLGRIGLGVHFPLDVLAGSGLGLFFGSLLPFLFH